MNVLIINSDCVGEGLAFALKCVEAKHKVRLYLDPDNNPTTGDGFAGVEKISNWVASVKWADVVFVTGNHKFIERLDALKKRGIKIFAPSKESTSLEINRGKGMKFLEKHGIQVPEYQEFKTLADAEAHVRKTEQRFVFKTLGDEDDKSLSYCSKSPADMIARLQRWQRLGMNPEGSVMLQEFIPGTEFAVSRWMGAKGFIGLYNENFEHKKLLSGNAGPNCGEAGTVQKYVDQSQIGDEVLAPLEKALVEMGHLGDIDVNCIVDEHGQAWPLEFTCRPGWPAFNIMLMEHEDPVEWMLDACNGKDTLKCKTDVACGIVLAQPDYPYSKATKKEVADIPIYGIRKGNKAHIQPQSVKVSKQPTMDGDKVVEKPIWSTTGDYLMVVTGLGDTVKQACARAYKTVSQIEVPDMIYRDDIGEKLKKEIPILHNQGYALEFEYQ